ncbi:MAG: orotate phosphoribosyltransferase [Acidobacteriaceae bacterium]
MPDARPQLLSLLVRLSYQEGSFTLSSGAVSDYYIDCRATTLNAQGALLTGEVVLNLIRSSGWQPDAIGGMTLGADPIVTATSLLSAQSEDYTPIQGFLVRKAEKSHGMQRQIEGFSQPAAKVVVVDDVCTTGASTMQAIAAIRAVAMQVMGVICLVAREPSGIANLKAAAAPAPVLSVFTVDDLRQHYRSQPR